MVSLSNLSYVSFNVVYVGVESCIFYFAAFIEIMKGCSRDLENDDDDDDDDDNDKVAEKVEENVYFDEVEIEENVDFDVSSILPPRVEENKILEIFVVC